MSWIPQSSFLNKWQNCDTEELSNLSKVTQLPNYGARIQIWEMGSRVYAVINKTYYYVSSIVMPLLYSMYAFEVFPLARRFIHLAAGNSSSPIFIADYCIMVWTQGIMHFNINEHLSFPECFSITNTAVMNISGHGFCAHMLFCFPLLQGMCLRGKLLGQRVH